MIHQGLKISNVSKISKSGAVLLDDLSLHVMPGEIMAIAGPAGSGKSLLLKAICGLTDITSGEIGLDGTDLVIQPPARRNIAMTFQQELIFENQSPKENILLGLKHEDLSERERENRLKFIVDKMNLATILDAQIEDLSAGQRQLLALARSLVREAKIYLLDEPFQHFDRMLRVTTRQMMRDLKMSLARPIIFVSQDFRNALAMADRLAVMDRGKIIECRPPQAIYHHPNTLLAAEATGSLNVKFRPKSMFSHIQNLDAACIRPEKLQLSDESDAKLQGHVWSVDFFGEVTVVIVRTTEDVLLRVTAFGTQHYSVGDPVHITYRDEDVLFFDTAGQRILDTSKLDGL